MVPCVSMAFRVTIINAATVVPLLNLRIYGRPCGLDGTAPCANTQARVWLDPAYGV